MKLLLLLGVAMLLGIGIQGRSAADALSDKTDAYIKEVMKGLHIPGLSLAVVREGKILKAQGYGQANLEHEVPARPETVYLLASMTKQFTATAIMMLVEEGKVGLDEKINKYLPDAPDAWKEISVRHLLTHTAGLKDRFEGKQPAEWLLNFTKEAMYRSARECTLDFKPGVRFQYSDQGYFLLGMIIEKVSGKSYRAFLTEQIFKPLGMDSTSTLVQPEIVKNLASGYTLAGGKLYHNNRRTDYGLVSHFGMISTVLDLAKWDAALYGDKLLKKSSLREMWTPALLDNGETAQVAAWSYGFGWFLQDFFGHRIVQHGGSTGTCIWRLPDDNTTVIVLTNLEQLAGGDATSIAKAISHICVPEVSWQAVKGKTDPDPELTRTLQAETLRIGAGNPDVSLYTPEYGTAVKAATQGSKGFYQSIGTLKTFAFLGSRVHGKGKTLFYRAVYQKATLYYTITLNGQGKIAFFAGEFEEKL